MTHSEDSPRSLLSLRQADILESLASDQKPCDESYPVFHPEFGRFMLEATPGKPWGIGSKELLLVEPDMKLR